MADLYGGIHPYNGTPAVTSASGYWPGQDVVRGIAVNRATGGGYVLDLFGGLHAFNGAPAAVGGPWWPGQDAVRGVILINGYQGYVLDKFGGLHDEPILASSRPRQSCLSSS